MVSMVHSERTHCNAECAHCGQPLPWASDEQSDRSPCKPDEPLYCCRGCAGAARIIRGLGLESFYSILASEQAQARRPVGDERSFDALPSLAVRDEGSDRWRANFHISGLRCYACSWLVENVVRRRFAHLHAEVNLTMGCLTLGGSGESTVVAQVASDLYHLGYELSDPALASGTGRRSLEERRDEVVRLGVAWFCSLNIMVLALGEYLAPDLQHDPVMLGVFHGLSGALGTVVLGYSSWPILRRAWAALRSRTVSVDLPIAVALLAAYGYSMAGIMLWRSEWIYLDSLTGAIALLLSGRWLQSAFLDRATQAMDDALMLREGPVRRLSPEPGWVDPSGLLPGHIFEVGPGEIVPVDCAVESQSGEMSLAALRGEFETQAVVRGDDVPSGAINGGRPMVARTIRRSRDSGIARTRSLAARCSLGRGVITTLTEKWARAFTWGVPAMAIGVLSWGIGHDPAEAMHRALALVLVACPCALGMAAPLIFSRGAALGLARGFVVRSQRVLESAARVRLVVFDKTGTMTRGRSVVREVRGVGRSASDERALALARALAETSHHHASRAVVEYLERKPQTSRLVRLEDVREEFGSGIHARCEGSEVFLGKVSDAAHGTVLSVDGQPLLAFDLDDEILPGTAAVMNEIRQLGVEVFVLSGDHPERTADIARRVGLEGGAEGGVSPLGKLRRIMTMAKRAGAHRLGGVWMVGNGLNDLAALARADLGIAAVSAPPSVRLTSDVLLLREGLEGVAELIRLARCAQWRLRGAIGIAAFYNVLGIMAAALGYLSPWVAAILMPLSSMGVVSWSTGWSVGPAQVQVGPQLKTGRGVERRWKSSLSYSR